MGLLSMGVIARCLAQMLKPFDLGVVVYDPFLTDLEATQLGSGEGCVRRCVSTCGLVSLHTPHFPETEGLITGTHFSSMKPGSTFINTARGAVVKEEEMIEVLTRRPDLQAVLDVTRNEPTERESPLFDLPNVVLTPHMAGSVGSECRRMGRYMVDELKRYLAGESLRYAVTPELAMRTTHRPLELTILPPVRRSSEEAKTIVIV